MTDLTDRLDAASHDDRLATGALYREASKEITRLIKIVDALTVKLNKELTASYGLDERLTLAEQRMAKLYQMLAAVRMQQTGEKP